MSTDYIFDLRKSLLICGGKYMSTKNSVLQALLSLKNGEFLSGEELASSCAVSRTAIWKAIKLLQEEGYKIEAVTNRGYRVLSSPDRLSSEIISLNLANYGVLGLKVFTFDEIDSTNSEAKRRAVDVGAFRDAAGNLTEKGKSYHISLFASESQTGGKGRLGRTFVSSADVGVYFSLLYSPKNGVKNPALYTAAAAVAVSRAIKNLYGENPSIKWVNDVFLAGKKISGILVEGIANFETGTIDAAVVGIGINDVLSRYSGNIHSSGMNILSSFKNNRLYPFLQQCHCCKQTCRTAAYDDDLTP